MSSPLPTRSAAFPPPIDDDAELYPLDALLRQIIGGFFLLTDGQGAVSKWGEPADLLFGFDGEEILGRPFFETLIAPPLPIAGDTWRRFLENGEPPVAPAKVELVARS